MEISVIRNMVRSVRPMKRIILFVFIGLSFTTCSSQTSIPSSKEFNKEAKEFFIDQYELFDLSPLDTSEKCILKNTILNDLDQMDNGSVTIFEDRYVIKNYFDTYLRLRFNFVKDILTNRFYFISLPQFDRMLYNVKVNYDEFPNGIYKLKAPREAIRINTSLIDAFFNDGDSFHDTAENTGLNSKFESAAKLIDKIFPDLATSNTMVSNFNSQMHDEYDLGRISESAFNQIMKLLEPLSLNVNCRIEAYLIDKSGFLLFIYSTDSQSSKMKIASYFVPEPEGLYISGFNDENRYKDCLKK